MNTITSTATLTGSERRSLIRLQDACRIHDRAELSYPLDESDATHFLNHLSDGTLISALAIIPCGDSIAECIAFTLPEYRRNGFFSGLLRRASEEFKEWDILFPVPGSPACLDTLAVLNALGAELAAREFQMEWQAGISPLASFTREGFALISPSPSRFELRRGDALCGSAEITLQPGNCACLHHVRILHELRGQGLGTLLVSLLIDTLAKSGIRRVLLHVSGDNNAALALYKKTGFSVTKTLSYYLY